MAGVQQEGKIGSTRSELVAGCRFANYLAHFCSNYVALQTPIWVTCQLPIECSLAWKARFPLQSRPESAIIVPTSLRLCQIPRSEVCQLVRQATAGWTSFRLIAETRKPHGTLPDRPHSCRRNCGRSGATASHRPTMADTRKSM
jgi:hypothetical protein